MKKMILLIAALCFATLCINGLAAQTNANVTALAAATIPEMLVSDSGKNLSQMNGDFISPGAFGVAQAVKFTPPEAGWKLKKIFIVGSDGWNNSSKEYPIQGIFGLEIRDAKLQLLYQYADTQLEYFTSPNGYRIANIEIPAIAMNDDFYVCFYGRDMVKTLTEFTNGTGRSYYFVREPLNETEQLIPAISKMPDNKTQPMNWIIRVAGNK